MIFLLSRHKAGPDRRQFLDVICLLTKCTASRACLDCLISSIQHLVPVADQTNLLLCIAAECERKPSILQAQPVAFLPNKLTAQMYSPQIPSASGPGADYNPKSDANGKGKRPDGPSSRNDGPTGKGMKRGGVYKCPQEGCGTSYSKFKRL
jgi:hypothetical protein